LGKLFSLRAVLGAEEGQKTVDAAEEEWAKMGGNPSMYGVGQGNSYTKTRDFLLKTNIEKIFPKEFIDTAFDFSQNHLDDGNIDELKLKYQAFKEGDLNSLNGSIFVDAIKMKLKQIDQSKLSSSDKKSLDDLFFLLDRIGEIKIVEARLIARLFDML
jgi:hypothetical protein